MSDGRTEALEKLIDAANFAQKKFKEMEAELETLGETEFTSGRWVPVTYFLGKSAQQWCEDHMRLKKEMQAESAGRKDEYLDVYVQVSAENERLKEELRIAENSWNFEEGKRIIAERDDLRRQRSAAIAEVKGLRDKLRAAEETRDKAEGEVERLHEQVTKVGILYDEAKEGLGYVTFEEAQKLYDDAEPMPLSAEKIDHIVKFVKSEETKDLAAEVKRLQEAANVAEGKRYATYAGRTVREWYEEVTRLRGLMSEAKKLIDQGSCDGQS